MSSGHKFTKFFIGSDPRGAAVAELLTILDQRCFDNGLEPTELAKNAHFVAMIVTGEDRWVHFDSKGHYQALNETEYEPVVPNLSYWRDSVTCWSYGKDSYTLRRYHRGEAVAIYANLNAGNQFDSMAAAEDWLPRFEAWEDILADGVDEDAFYQNLPAPTTLDTPMPTFSTPASELPKRLADIFGWDERLSKIGVAKKTRQDQDLTYGYRSLSGEFTDAETGFRTIIRCYAHPNPAGQHSRHCEG